MRRFNATMRSLAATTLFVLAMAGRAAGQAIPLSSRARVAGEGSLGDVAGSLAHLFARDNRRAAN